MDEFTTLYKVLRSLRIEDVNLEYDGKGLVATDSMNNEWHGKEFYKFLVEEAFVFQDDGSILGIRDEILSEFKIHSERYGVPVVDNRY